MQTKTKRIVIFAVFVLICTMTACAFSVCSHEWKEATCLSPATCGLCGETKGEALSHAWQAATCTQKESCSRCGLMQGEALGHDFTELSCTEDSRCSRCGEISQKAAGHQWEEATCQRAKTCSVCGAVEGEPSDHQWKQASCLEPKTCPDCSLTQGEPLGHDWKEASCAAPKHCTRCLTTEGQALPHTWEAATCQRPQTCSVCGATQGESLPHSFTGKPTCTEGAFCESCQQKTGEPLGHDWQSATCTLAKRCSRCGATEGNALGHSYAGDPATCTRCGYSANRKYVAITFDDGPSGPVTRELLEGLRQRGVKATFFLCGYRIRMYPTLPQSIFEGGHEIGLHTMNHATLTQKNEEGIRQELEGMLEMLPEDCKVRLMRPPGGAYNATVKAVCADMGLSLIMWSVDPQDWGTRDAALVADRVVNATYDGSIILLHDMYSSSVQGALAAIDRLMEQGYEFVTVSELAAMKGYSLQEGQVYHSFR